MNNMVEAQENPVAEYKLSPESLRISEVYLSCLDITETARELDISQEEVTHFLNKKEVKRFMDTVWMEQGYRNRYKLGNLLDTIVESKLEEAEESEVYTNKDLLDVIQVIGKMRIEELKIMKDIEKISSQTNVQINDAGASSNLGKLIESLVK